MQKRGKLQSFGSTTTFGTILIRTLSFQRTERNGLLWNPDIPEETKQCCLRITELAERLIVTIGQNPWDWNVDYSVNPWSENHGWWGIIILCNHPISGDKKPPGGAGRGGAGVWGAWRLHSHQCWMSWYHIISFHFMARQHSNVFSKLVADHPSIRFSSFIHSFVCSFVFPVHSNRAQDWYCETV